MTAPTDVGIVLGSASDWPLVSPAAVLLKDWGIAFEVVVASAHRAPKRVQAYAREAAARKGWLAPEDVLNTYPPAEVAELLRRRRAG